MKASNILKVKALLNTMGADKLPEAVEDALAQVKASGEFDGRDGVSPTVSISKDGGTTTITIKDVNGVHTATIEDGLDASQGGALPAPEKGNNGNNGNNKKPKPGQSIVVGDVDEDGNISSTDTVDVPANTLPAPATAAPGQMIVVKAVDENGVVTATEAVDPPENTIVTERLPSAEDGEF